MRADVVHRQSGSCEAHKKLEDLTESSVQLAENFGGRYAVHDIREALGSLTDDGKAYNTSGENFMHCAC